MAHAQADAAAEELPFIDAEEKEPAEEPAEEAAAAARASSRPSSRPTSRPSSRPASRRPSRSPSVPTSAAEEGDAAEGGAAEGGAAAAEGGGRRTSAAAGSRGASRRSSRALLDADFDGGRRRSSARRGSQALDLAEVVIAELRRPTRRSSRAIALELGEIVSVEVRRQSRRGSGGSVVEEVSTQVRRQSRSGRPSLLAQRGSAAASYDDADDDDDEPTDHESDFARSGPPALLEPSSRVPQYVAAFVVNLASFCNGVTFGWPAIALPLLQSRMSPIEGSPLGAEESSWLASAICLAAAVAIPPWVVVNDRYGRKIAGYLVGLCFALHWIVLGVTRNTACLYTARVIGGLGSAGVFIVCPTYVKEIAEDAIRGELGVMVTVMFNLGILVTYAVGAGVSYKGVNILGISFVLLFVLAFWQLPESPVYLLSKGRTGRAARSLQWLRGRGYDVMDELSEMRRANKRRREEGDASLFDVLSDRASFKGIVITTLLCINQPLCGLPVVLSYTVNIFMEAGDSISPNLATIIVGLLLLVCSYVASHLVDRAGRKMMIVISNAGVAASTGALGIYFFIKQSGINVESLNLGWLPITSLSAFVITVSLGVAPLPFVVMTEIFLPQAQKVASILGYCIIWLFSFIATKFFTNIASALGLFSCYWIFSAFCVLMCVFVQLYMPETKGRSLDSILDELSGEKRPLINVHEKDENNHVRRNEVPNIER